MSTALTNTSENSIPEVGGDSDNWGGLNNAVHTAWDSILGGFTQKSLAAAASTITLTTDEAKPGRIEFTGLLTNNVTVNLPARKRTWVIRNSCTGTGFNVTLSISGAIRTVGVPKSTAMMLFTDGSNVYPASHPVDNSSLNAGFAASIRHPGKSYDGAGMFFSDKITGFARRATGTMGVVLADGIGAAGASDSVRFSAGNTTTSPIIQIADPFDGGFSNGFYVPSRDVLAMVVNGFAVASFQRGIAMTGVTGGDPGQGGINASLLQFNGVRFMGSFTLKTFTSLGSGNQTYSIAHNLASKPTYCKLWLRATATDRGYTAGMSVDLSAIQSGGTSALTTMVNATTVEVTQVSTILLPNRTSYSVGSIDPAKWAIDVYLGY